MNAAVFLDRDGTLNRIVERNNRPFPPDTLQDFVLLPGVPEALAQLRAAGYRLIVATNQPDVGKGVQQESVVRAMHEQLAAWLPIDDIYVCYHVDEDGCACRKPRPGMLVEAAAKWKIDLTRSYMVGDRWRDVGAGQAAGCTTIWIETKYEERRPEKPDAIVPDMKQAADWILGRQR